MMMTGLAGLFSRADVGLDVGGAPSGCPRRLPAGSMMAVRVAPEVRRATSRLQLLVDGDRQRDVPQRRSQEPVMAILSTKRSTRGPDPADKGLSQLLARLART